MTKVVGLSGCQGWIGSYVRSFLVGEGYEVVSIDPYLRGKGTPAFPSGPPSWILHFAARTSIADSFASPVETIRANIDSSLRAFEIAAVHKSAFLFMSSYVYGPPQYLPIDEMHPVRSTNPYMASKILGELACSESALLTGIPLTILRVFNIYGPGLKKGRLISDLFESALRNEPLSVNDSRPRRDYLYIKDFCRLITKILSAATATDTFNVGSGSSHTNLEVARVIAEIFGLSKEIQSREISRQNDILTCYADIHKVSERFDWTPEYTLQQGLEDMRQIRQASSP